MDEVEETSNIIRARINELELLVEAMIDGGSFKAKMAVEDRLHKLHEILKNSSEDVMGSILESHKAVCEAKQMGPKEAYGHDPAVYYTLAIAGEAGEMANEIVKALRDGNDEERVKIAVESELPDVIIYSYVLAHVLDINLTKRVAEKVKIVIERARSGYYGGPLSRTSNEHELAAIDSANRSIENKHDTNPTNG